jgi:hypothetical protein
MTQYLGKQQQLVMTGTVQGGQLLLKVDGGRRQEKTVPWNDEVIGLSRQERLFQEKKVKPGDRFDYLTFEPTITSVLHTSVSVKDYEDVDVLKGTQRVKARLLRTEAVADKIQNIQLPILVTWLDERLQPVRSQLEMPGLGQLTLYRTTRAVALQRGETAQLTDIGITQLIPVHRRIPQPYETESAVYRITLKGEKDPGTAFVTDERQQVRNANPKDGTLELHVRASRGPQATADGTKMPGKEFLQSCYFINSDDAEVKKLTAKAVGPEPDPWKKALRIEKWVHDHMENKNFTEAFATADEVARTLEGDCTEHSMLAAAMSRAAGIPSRTAVGLVYVEDARRGPVMGFHMWTEVWVQGQWIPIDATLGKSFVGATHIKITDHSWYQTQSLTPLLPVVRVLGKMAIQVVSVNGGN